MMKMLIWMEETLQQATHMTVRMTLREQRNGYNSQTGDTRNDQARYNRFNSNNAQDYRYGRDDENDNYRQQSRYNNRDYGDNQESDDDEYDDDDDDAGYHGPARRSSGNHYNSKRRRYGPRRHGHGRRREYPDREQGGYGRRFDDRDRYNYSPNRRWDRSNRNPHGQYNYNNAPEGSNRFSNRNTGPLLRGNVMGRHAPVLGPIGPENKRAIQQSTSLRMSIMTITAPLETHRLIRSKALKK